MPTVHELSSNPYARLPPPSTRVTKNGSAVAEIEKKITEEVGKLRADVNLKRASDDGDVVLLPNPLQRRSRRGYSTLARPISVRKKLMSSIFCRLAGKVAYLRQSFQLRR